MGIGKYIKPLQRVFLNLSGGTVSGDTIFTGNLSVGASEPSALLHLTGGTATAGTAPIKFTSGTTLTTPEVGAMEYDGTNLDFTRTGTTREHLVTSVGTTFTNTGVTGSISVIINGTTYKLMIAG